MKNNVHNMGNAIWIGVPQRVREMLGEISVYKYGEWLPPNTMWDNMDSLYIGKLLKQWISLCFYMDQLLYN